MLMLYSIVGLLVDVVIMLIIVQFVIGLLFAFNVINNSNQFLANIYDAIDRLMRPVLDPIRRVMPDTGAIDFSPLVLILGLQIVLIIFGNLAMAG